MVSPTKTPQGSRLNPQNTLELSQGMSIQTALNTADAHGGRWTLLLYPGANYNEGDITPSGAADITIKAMGEGRVVIAPTVAPAAGVIVSGGNLTLEDVTVIAPTNAFPAIRVTAGLLQATRCTITGVGAGDVIQQVGGTIHWDSCEATQGNITLDTDDSTLTMHRGSVDNGNIVTAGAGIAHNVTLSSVDVNGNNITNGATGATTVLIEKCSAVNAFTDASLLGTVTVEATVIVTATKTGTSPWTVRIAEFGTLSNNNAAGAITCFGGLVYSCGGAVGVITWQVAANSYECVPGMNINHAVGVGRYIFLHPGAYAYTANVSLSAGVTLEGSGPGNTTLTFSGAAVTNGIVMAGDDIVVRGLEVVLAAGVGAGGSRPNCIYATGRTELRIENVRVYGDVTVVDDGSDVRQCGILWTTVTDSKVINCRSQNQRRHGINLDAACDNNEFRGNECTGNTRDGLRIETGDSNIITGNNCSDNAQHGMQLANSALNTISANTCNGAAAFAGIQMTGASAEYNTVTGNTCEGNGIGIEIQSGPHNTISSNICLNNTGNGIHTEYADFITITGNTCCGNAGWGGIDIDESENCTVSGNLCEGNTRAGIMLMVANHDCVVSDNICYGNDLAGNQYPGIWVYQGDRVVVSNNHCEANGTHGIYLDDADGCSVEGNYCSNQNTGDGVHLTGEAGGTANDNVIRDNTLLGNAGDGVEIEGAAFAARNRVFANRFSGNGGLCLNDGGADTMLAVQVVPFVDGSDPQDSGFEIDLGGEFARTYLRLPEDVHQVLGMKVYARSVVLEAHEMELEMVVLGGADNEPYNTHDGSVAQLDSVSANFAADDIIFWRNTEAGTLALVGGDSVEVKVLHEAAEGDNCATDAFFRTVEVAYV